MEAEEQQGFFLRGRNQEEKDEIARAIAEFPLAYFAPDEFELDDIVCGKCASKLIEGEIEDYNKERGFDWCGRIVDGDEDLEEDDPFFVVWGAELTVNQIDKMVEILDEGHEMWIEEWIEDDYHGEPCAFVCIQCEGLCVSIDSSELLAGVNATEMRDEEDEDE